MTFTNTRKSVNEIDNLIQRPLASFIKRNRYIKSTISYEIVNIIIDMWIVFKIIKYILYIYIIDTYHLLWVINSHLGNV